jgi:hypothetical protein
LLELTALFRILGLVTALLRICAGPTLFRGTSCETAAMLVPARATNSARQATTNDGDGRVSGNT